MTLKVYNTLLRTKQEFKPIKDGEVSMYVCGITAYDMSHIGHARVYVAFDCIYRYLKYKGYKVKYARNFTDIDDKIIKRANELKVPFNELSQKYINEFYKDMDALNVLRPEVEPKVSEHIPHIIEFIEEIIKNGHAYVVDGNVYYSVESFPYYGKLSGRKLDDMVAGASERVEVDPNKKNPFDFALWKKSKPGEPSWDSPWGKGRPGWHIECSTMSRVHLGDVFDIHGGGKDLIFPHHENEIAQSEAVVKKQHVNYWLHNGFVNVDKEKMSKSLGNFFTVREVLEIYHPEVLRYFLLSTHYRSPINYSTENIEDATSRIGYYYYTLKGIFDYLKKRPEKEYDEKQIVKKEVFDNASQKLIESMDDDFNTAQAVGLLSEPFKIVNDLLKKKKSVSKTSTFRYFLKMLKPFQEILGILDKDPDRVIEELTEKALKRRKIDKKWIEEMIEKRNVARKEKNYELADKIRAELTEKGVMIMDTPEGTVWRAL